MPVLTHAGVGACCGSTGRKQKNDAKERQQRLHEHYGNEGEGGRGIRCGAQSNEVYIYSLRQESLTAKIPLKGMSACIDGYLRGESMTLTEVIMQDPSATGTV